MGFFDHASHDNMRLESPEDLKRVIMSLQRDIEQQNEVIEQLKQGMRKLAGAVQNLQQGQQDIYNQEQYNNSRRRSNNGPSFGQMFEADLLGDVANDILKDIF